jgi:hypothetical protein
VKTNQEGIDLLAKGQVAAYFADRATLTFLLRKEKEGASLLMADTYLSVEPIALAVAISASRSTRHSATSIGAVKSSRFSKALSVPRRRPALS